MNPVATETKKTDNPGVEERRPQKSLFDLDTMGTVTLYKPYNFHEVTGIEQAQARIGHDTKKLIEIINRGLQSFEDEKIKADKSVPWLIEVDDPNDPNKTTMVEFTGTPADDKLVNAMVLNMAKGSFGYLKAKDAAGRSAAKDAALAFIKSQPVLIAGMKAQLESESESDTTVTAEDLAANPA